MELGYVIGWVGVALGVAIPIPQLRKMLKTKSMGDVSTGTYALLVPQMMLALMHAVYINSLVFISTYSFAVIMNGIILAMLIRHNLKRRRK